MKYLPHLFFLFAFSAWAQPNVCKNPPSPYILGGGFQFVITQPNGMAKYGDDVNNQVCVGNSPVSIGLVNENTSSPPTHRYLFDVKDDIFVPKPSEFSLQDIFPITVANKGEYWVMQIEERDGKLFLACKSLEIRSPEKPSAMSDLLASVNEDGIPVVFTEKIPVPGQDFSIFLEPGQVLLDIQSLPFWELPSIDATMESKCFSTQYQGECSVMSEISAPICTPFLNVKDQLVQWNTPTIGDDWQILGYQVLHLLPNGKKEVLLKTTSTEISLNAIQGERTRLIQIEVLLENKLSKNKESIFSNSMQVNAVGQLYFPTVFTPNQDGLNDFWWPVSGTKPVKFQLSIFNRSGEIIFSSNEFSNQEWDGTIDGKDAPPGIYVFRAEFELVFGQNKVFQGIINLIR